MLKRVQQMQEDMANLQEDLDSREYTASAGGDMVTVTVTGYSVYLRNGPGTNYGIVGSTWEGKTFVITHAVKGGDYLWGMSDKGWIALEFTNYADIAQPEPPATEPPVTEPPVTDPSVTEPPVTEPPATEPPATEPPVTEPPEAPIPPRIPR
jgi:hypothetical protein